MNNEAFSTFFAATSKRKENSEKQSRQSKKSNLLPENTDGKSENKIQEETPQCKESDEKDGQISEVNVECSNFQRVSTIRIGETKTLEKKCKILASTLNENEGNIKAMERNEQIITEISTSDEVKMRNVIEIQKTDNSICVRNSEVSKSTLKEELVGNEGDENISSFSEETIKNDNVINAGKKLEEDNEIISHSTDDVIAKLLRRSSRSLFMQNMNVTESNDSTSYNIQDKNTMESSDLNLVESIKEMNKGNESMTLKGDNATNFRTTKLVRGSQTFRYKSNQTQNINDNSSFLSDKSKKNNCVDEISFIDDDNQESKYSDNIATTVKETSVSDHISYYNHLKENITLRREISTSNDNKIDVSGLSVNEQSSSERKKAIKLITEGTEKDLKKSESTKIPDSTTAVVNDVKTTKGFNWFKSKRNVTKKVLDESPVEQIQDPVLKNETSNCQQDNIKANETISTNIVRKCSEPQNIFIATGVRPLVVYSTKNSPNESPKFYDKNISESGANYSSHAPKHDSTCDSGVLDNLSSDGKPLDLSDATDLLRKSTDEYKLTSNQKDPVNSGLEKSNESIIGTNDNNKTIEQNSLKLDTLKSFDSSNCNVVFNSRTDLKSSDSSIVCGEIVDPNSCTQDQKTRDRVEIQAESLLLSNSFDNSNLDSEELTTVLGKEDVSDLEATQNSIDRSIPKITLSRSESVCSNDSFRSVSSVSSQSSDISYKSVVGEKVFLEKAFGAKASNDLSQSNTELSKSVNELSKSNNSSSKSVNENTTFNNDSSKSLSDTDTSQISTDTSTKSKSRKKNMKFSIKSSKTSSPPKKDKLTIDVNNDVPKEKTKLESPTTPEPMTVFMATSGVRPVLSFRKLKLFDSKTPSETPHSKEKEKAER